jgi:hypothetical protein
MTSSSDLEALRITRTELDQLTGLDISSVFMGGIIRPSVFRSWRQLLSLLISECLVMGVIFIICVGIGLVLVRNQAGFSQFGALLLGIAGVIVMGAIAWHLYQWQHSKRFMTLAHLLDEVDRHNDIIQALKVMDELAAVQPNQPSDMPNRDAVTVALQATRDSLTAALMTERILRRHRNLMERQQELCRDIETNLTMLQTLRINYQASEYQQFLQEALDIGLAVQEQIVGRKGS